MKRSAHFWKKRKLLDKIGYQLGVQKQEDWYSIRREQIRKVSHTAQTLLNTNYNSCLFYALKHLYPEFDWNPLYLRSVPHHHWKVKKNQRDLMDWVAEQLDIEKQEDWYNVTAQQVKQIGAENVVKMYNNGSLFSTLEHVYNEFEWDHRLFPSPPRSLSPHVPPNHWMEEKNRRTAMDWIAEQLGVEEQSDWYTVSTRDIRNAGGAFIYTYHNGSLYAALQNLYPEFEWDPFQFDQAPHAHKEKKKLMKHREVFDRVSEQLGIQQQSEWYQMTGRAMKPFSEAYDILSEHYDGSLFNGLQKIYPEFHWNPLLCVAPPVRFWERLTNAEIKDSLDDMLEGVGMSQWRLATSSRLSHRFGGINGVMRVFYPGSNWGVEGSLSESVLDGVLKNVCKAERWKNIEGYSLDFYLPQLSLAIEYQGGQHYKQIHTGNLKKQKERDWRKRKVLKQLGINLVEVPYWWNGKYSSLLATLAKHPGIFQSNYELQH